MVEQSEPKEDSERVTTLLERIAELCPVPAAAQRVMMLAGAEDADIGSVAEAIAGDPALAAETMRIANSAVFRRGRPVETLGHAVLTLGLSQVHQMALAMALMASFRTEHEVSLAFHRSSVLAGSFAGLLAGYEGEVDRGIGFIAGLLSEVGAMACVAVDGAAYAGILERAAGDWEVRAELEREHYTLASWEIGERLLVRNELPESITTAVGKHYDQPSGSLGPTGRVTAFGRVIAPELMALGPEGEVQELADRMMQVARLCDLDVDSDVLVQLAERAMAAAEETLVSG